jgi:hypothetical protein
MTFAFKIKETAKSKGLIAHLQSLAYVEPIDQPSPKILSEKEMITAVRRAEKSKSIPLAEAIKQSEQWQHKIL